jgi:hypothetical protein
MTSTTDCHFFFDETPVNAKTGLSVQFLNELEKKISKNSFFWEPSYKTFLVQ